MSILKNRYEFMVVFSATMCNPNGDPDMANAPRIDLETGCGFVTDVAIKRWMRNYVGDAYTGEDGMDILMTQGASLNKKIAQAVLTVNGVENADKLPKNKKTADASEYICKRYWDCRAFGGVLSTGLNAGQIRGAVQMEMPVSVDPVQVSNLTITRMCYTNDKDSCKTIEDYEKEEAERADDTKRTMGEKQIVSFGLYVLRGTVSAAFAERVGFTEHDLQVTCEALTQMLAHNVSSSKSGMRLESPVILFKHVGTQSSANAEQKAKEAKLGCVPAQMLFGLLNIEKKDGIEYPRSASDYDMTFNLSGMPSGVQVGFKQMPFEDFTWGEDIRGRNYGIAIK